VKHEGNTPGVVKGGGTGDHAERRIQGDAERVKVGSKESVKERKKGEHDVSRS